MSFSYTPDYTLDLYRPQSFGSTRFTGIYRLSTIIRADVSLMVANGVGQASIQLSDLDGAIKRGVNPQPMDLLRIGTNAPGDRTIKTIWTGYIDSATERYDPQAGNSLVLDATTGWKLFEISTQQLAVPGSSGSANAVFALALASLQGIGARDLIRYAAQASHYPGSLAGLQPTPGGLQLYDGPEYVGQRSFSLPDNASTEPDLQTYAAVLSGLARETGMELFADEYSSLVFRPIGYLSVPTRPYRIEDDQIIEAELALSDQDVVSQVRVRWAFDAYYQQDGYAPLPSDAQTAAGVASLAGHLGTRVLVVDAPWILTRDAADFLAKSLLQQFAAGVAVGTITTPANPAVRVGTVIDVPGLTNGLGHTYYYVLQKTYALQWGAAWTETLTLAYGRDPTQGFPYIGSQTRPNINAPLFNTPTGGGAAAGIPTGTGGLAYTATGQQSYSFPLAQDRTLANTDAAGPYPVGTVLRVATDAGHPLGDSPNGDYTVVRTNSGTDTTISISNIQGTKQTTGVTVVQYGPATDSSLPGSATSAAGNPPLQQSTPTTQSAGSGSSAGPVTSTDKTLPAAPTSLAQRALALALTQNGGTYVEGTQGPNSWDCSGLVWWAYAGSGYSWPRLNAGDQYRWFSGRNCPTIDLSMANPGDLLLFGDMTDANNQHIGFLHSIQTHLGGIDAVLYSAMNPTDGIGDCNVFSFHTLGGLGLSYVLNMQQFTGH